MADNRGVARRLPWNRNISAWRWPVRTGNPLFDPSDGWFCPNLLGGRSANPLFDPSDGWFLPELARRFVPLIPHPILYPSSFLPTGGSCPNLPEIRSAHPSSLIPHPSFRRVVLARTCPKFVLLILHPSSIILPSDGWFLPELARKFGLPILILFDPFRWVVFARTCSEFVLLILHRFIPHPSFRRVVFARTCSEIRSAHPSHPSSLILPSDGWFLPELARKFGLPSAVRSWLVPNREFGLGRNGGTGGPRRARMLQPGGQFCLSRNHRNLRIRTLGSFPLMILRSGKGHCAFECAQAPGRGD